MLPFMGVPLFGYDGGQLSCKTATGAASALGFKNGLVNRLFDP